MPTDETQSTLDPLNNAAADNSAPVADNPSAPSSLPAAADNPPTPSEAEQAEQLLAAARAEAEAIKADALAKSAEAESQLKNNQFSWLSARVKGMTPVDRLAWIDQNPGVNAALKHWEQSQVKADPNHQAIAEAARSELTQSIMKNLPASLKGHAEFSEMADEIDSIVSGIEAEGGEAVVELLVKLANAKGQKAAAKIEADIRAKAHEAQADKAKRDPDTFGRGGAPTNHGDVEGLTAFEKIVRALSPKN